MATRTNTCYMEAGQQYGGAGTASSPRLSAVDMWSSVYEHDSSVGLGELAALASSLKVTCKGYHRFYIGQRRLKEEAAKLGIDFQKNKKLFLIRTRKGSGCSRTFLASIVNNSHIW